MRRVSPSDQNLLVVLAICITCLASASPPASAQTAPITSSGLNTQINLSPNQPIGKVQYDITGGTRPGGGANLFHSFGNFEVPHNNIANFRNDSGLLTSNILGRITGGNISEIFGAIQTQSFGNANLFLLNPAGFLFGPNATVDVGGMVSFTSADYLKLSDGIDTGYFYADPTKPSLLTASPVAAFGFLGSNPGAIAVQGSRLSVTPGLSISLVGGNITIQSGTTDGGKAQSARLVAPNGTIQLASTASPGEFEAATLLPLPNINGASFTSVGSVSLAPGSTVDVSQTGNGKVSIRGGQLVIDIQNAFLSTADPAAPAVITPGQDTIVLSGGTSIASVTNSSNAGNIGITADTLTLDGFSIIQANVSSGSQGHGGNIDVHVRDASLEGGSSILTGTLGPGDAGNINMQADQKITLTGGAAIATNSFDFGSGAGNAGLLHLTASTIELQVGSINSLSQGPGNAGNIILEFNSLMAENRSSITSETIGPGRGGDISIQGLGGPGSRASDVTISGGTTLTSSTSGGGRAGDITVLTERIALTNASMRTSTFAAGNAGNLTLNASDSVHVSTVSSLESQSLVSAMGNAGQITITTPSLTVDQGGIISTGTSGTGDAGTLTVNSNSVRLLSGGQLTSSSSIDLAPGSPLPAGSAGTITIQGLASPAPTLHIDGSTSGISTTTQGTGKGGNISINANSVTLQNGSHISSSSTGPGVAGDITINADSQFAMTNSSVTTDANQSSGGTIKITTNPDGTMQLTDSTISASVLDGTGGGGSVNIDPQYVVLQNSQILAKAVYGPGGNINITTSLLLPDSTSVISASSQFGQPGTITIQSPIAPASGKIIPLPQKPLIATTLLSQRCAALAGGTVSTFTVAGRDALPAVPGGWLSSLLALSVSESHGGAVKEAGSSTTPSEVAEGPPLLTLRKIAPPGFLTQRFAVDVSTGCSS
jgi:filamentous hemagglutinin family protein